MTTFTVEIHEDIVTWLKKSTCPEIVLDLPSVPEPGDKLWLKSMRGIHIAQTERCTIVESRRVSRLRPTVRLVFVFGIETNHGHDESHEQDVFRESRKKLLFQEIIRRIRSDTLQILQIVRCQKWRFLAPCFIYLWVQNRWPQQLQKSY